MTQTVEEINRRIFALWERQFSDDADTLCPLIYSEFIRNSLLFVGLNPSFTTNWQKKLQQAAPEALDISTFFLWRNRKQFDFDKAQQLERYSKDNYKVLFGKLSGLAEDIDMPWEHVDLFFYRETKQNSLKPIVGIEGEGISLNEFGNEQLTLSKSLIEISTPRIIVVANVLASRLFAMLFKPRFSDEYGYHFVDIRGREVPTFFSSMLTGGRALDVFSFQRLKWHILQAKNRSN